LNTGLVDTTKEVLRCKYPNIVFRLKLFDHFDYFFWLAEDIVDGPAILDQ